MQHSDAAGLPIEVEVIEGLVCVRELRLEEHLDNSDGQRYLVLHEGALVVNFTQCCRDFSEVPTVDWIVLDEGMQQICDCPQLLLL